MSEIEHQPKTEPALRYQCRHIFTEGRRCQSPALRTGELCFFHQASRPTRTPLNRQHTGGFELPRPDDRAAIQIALGEIITRVATCELDLKRARVLIYALHVAANNLPRPALTATEPPIMLEEDFIEDATYGPLAPPTPWDTRQTPFRQITLEELLLADWRRGPQPPQAST